MLLLLLPQLRADTTSAVGLPGEEYVAPCLGPAGVRFIGPGAHSPCPDCCSRYQSKWASPSTLLLYLLPAAKVAHTSRPDASRSSRVWQRSACLPACLLVVDVLLTGRRSATNARNHNLSYLFINAMLTRGANFGGDCNCLGAGGACCCNNPSRV